MKGRKGVPRNLQLLWKIRPPLARVLVKRPGHESQRRTTLGAKKGGGKEPKRQRTPLQRSTFQNWTVEGWQYRRGSKARTWEQRSKRRCLGRRKSKRVHRQGGRYCFDGVSAQGAAMKRSMAWECPRDQWSPKLFWMESTPQGLELKNSFGALDERDSADEISLLSVEKISRHIYSVRNEKNVQRWKIEERDTKTTKRQRADTGQPLCVK